MIPPPRLRAAADMGVKIDSLGLIKNSFEPEHF
jgi:hypothetical protein